MTRSAAKALETVLPDAATVKWTDLLPCRRLKTV